MADENADELSVLIREIQDRVRARHPNGAGGAGEIPLADLMPLLHARDAAGAKMASIGSVNPRPPGLKNAVVQFVKRLVARALDWHVREQVEFNRGVIACVQATLEALTAQNRALSLTVSEQNRALSQAVAGLSEQDNRLLDALRATETQLFGQVGRLDDLIHAVVTDLAGNDSRLQGLIEALGEENLRRSAEITGVRGLMDALGEENLRRSAEISGVVEESARVAAELSGNDNRLRELIETLGEENLRRSAEITGVEEELTGNDQRLEGLIEALGEENLRRSAEITGVVEESARVAAELSGNDNRLGKLIESLGEESLRRSAEITGVAEELTGNDKRLEGLIDALGEENLRRSAEITDVAGESGRGAQALRDSLSAFAEEVNRNDSRLHELVNALGEENLRRSAEITALGVETASLQELRDTAGRLEDESRQLRDIRAHWAHWRQEWEAKLSHNEIVFLRNLAESHSAFQHRVTLLEEAYRDLVKTQHSDFEKSLSVARLDIQKRLWDDLLKMRAEYDAVIHRELRTLRQRVIPMAESGAPAGEEAAVAGGIDWLAFAERFRGSEEHVRAKQRMYAERFEGCRNVLDLGCGRGELLEVLKDAGIGARGIDANAECIALCRDKGLQAETADLFAFLANSGEQFDAIVSAQVVEHLPPLRLPELVRLASERLRPGGVLALETPNPECLAILATHFWLDPTHTRPVPAPLLSFWMEEAGLGGIEVVPLNPASESIAAVNSLPEDVRAALFGGMDYAIFARKLPI